MINRSKPSLVLGTAEFGSKPYGEGRKSPLVDDEIKAILDLAYGAGIKELDTAEAYQCRHSELFSRFSIITKSREAEKMKERVLYHYTPYEPKHKGLWGASLYNIEQFDSSLNMAQVPFNVDNQDFRDTFNLGVPIYLRSIFDRGKLLLKGFTVKQCLAFARRQPVEAVIVGVNSKRELEEILKEW